MVFSRQEYWSGLPSPPLGDLPHPGIKPMSLHWQAGSWQAGSLPLALPGKCNGHIKAQLNIILEKISCVCGASPLRMWCTHWSSSHYMLFLWIQDAKCLTMKHRIQSELLITKYFHTNKVMMYSINSQHSGNSTFGNEAKQSWRTQMNPTNGYHRAPSHPPLLYLCRSHLCPAFEVPSP